MFRSTILLVPGLGNSGEQHWQSYWEKSHHFQRVQQADWETPSCQDWVETLDKTVTQFNTSDVILVGHSLACATIAWWAAKYERSIKGALLVAPADVEAPDFPAVASGFSPMPVQLLPFPSTVVASANDPYVSLARALYFAGSWGSQFHNIGAAGHINAASDLKDWHQGLMLLQQLEKAA